VSVDAIGGSSVPGFYSYPSVPASTAASSASSSSTISPYVSEYDTLLQQDASELLDVSLGTPAAAASNVSSVLAQAAALQAQQLAAQRQTAATASVPTIATPAVPTLSSIQQQSDTDASTDLSNGTLGASIDASA
jgi:hypothetical protein